MGKKRRLLVVILICIIAIMACTRKADTVMTVEKLTEAATLTEEGTTLTEEGTTENTTQEQLKNVTTSIYYGNKSADGLKAEEKTFGELTETNLIAVLSRHNIVSIDTKVQKFEVTEENGKVIIYLDLSKQFNDYIGMMGINGEYIVLAGLTNTFLDAYDADSMVLTIDGKTLKTKHDTYEKPFARYPMEEEKNATVYTLEEEKQVTETTDIRYPQFAGMADKERMNKWNNLIKETAVGTYDTESMKEYKVDYEVTAENAGLLSMIIRGSFYSEGAAYPYTFKRTFNFELSGGGNLRLKEYTDIGKIAECLRQGTGFTILTEGITEEDVKEYLESGFITDYSVLLEDFDFDFDNRNMIPTGYSYIKENTIILVMEVNHAMGDFLELRFDAEQIQ